MTKQLAALALKACACFIAPLAAAFSSELAAQHAAAVATSAPKWAEYVVAPNLMHLGAWVGPGGHEKSRIAPLN
eukprot:639887-Pyramimonas_sp.AAC.1